MKFKIAFTSMIATVVAMGLGRFALTPQMPHMLMEGRLNLTQASLLAASNFLGYLLGAIEITRAKHDHLMFRLYAGLWGSGIILILSTFIPNNAAGVYINMFLRFTAGVASAWALILITTWVQHALAREHSLRTLAFTGPGVGIMLSGILAVVFDYWHTNSSFNWFIFGMVAIIGIAAIGRYLPDSLPQVSQEKRFVVTDKVYLLIITYILCAIGYVLPATFLSKLAVDQFPGSLMADAFWPLFGFSVIVGMGILASQSNIKNPQKWLAGIFCIQGVGILACTYLPGISGLLIGALFVGGSFMVILQLMMQLGAELCPHHLRTITGILTIGFAIGQFIGPLLSALSTHWWSTMTPALLTAAIGSFIAAMLISTLKSQN
jgi:MFS family permease